MTSNLEMTSNPTLDSSLHSVAKALELKNVLEMIFRV